MKRIIFGSILVLAAGMSVPATGANTDSEGMPIIYLRGGFNNTGWSPNEKYKFSRNGNEYTLTIDRRNAIGDCEFKIGDDSWENCDIGGGATINSSQYVEGISRGSNFSTSGFNDCVISFTYVPEALTTTVKFIVNGEEIKDVPEPEPEPLPEPGEFPDVYLRGNFNNTNWAITDAYRFTRDNDKYTLRITTSNPLPAGCEFKIASEDWTSVDLGAPGEGTAIDNTQNISLSYKGVNMTTRNGITDGSITFTYNPESASTLVSFYVEGSQKLPVGGLSGTLPVLYINVYKDENHSAYNNEVISKDLNHKNYFEYAEYWLDVNGCKWLEDLGAKSIGSEEEPLALQIKARGNWTRIGFSKKPFKLKLDKKQSLLGLSKSKHFAILAHADDNKGYLRNFVGFELGKRIGLPWTPSQQPVEVVINGDYRGLYFLTESIRVDEDRVNITELGDNEEDSKLVSGGYIVELDNYDEDDSHQIRMEEKHISGLGQNYDMLRITFDTPEEYSDLQRFFITDQFSTMNDYVGQNNDLLWSYLDLDDAARYYLVEEIVSHTESYHGSTYLFRDYGDGQKWHFSPLWDFGNAFNGRTDDYFYNCDPYGNTWIPSMRENAKFNTKVKETWLWFMQNEYPGIEKDIDDFAEHVKAAAQADYNRWKGQPVPGGGQPVADNRDMSGKANEVKDHLNSKTNWLKRQFGDYTNGRHAEPERDTTPAAELPKYVATDVIGVVSAEENATIEYYNLQGIRVNNPRPGTICIVRKGNKSYKTIIK